MADLAAYAREVMAEAEKRILTPEERDRGVRLDWVAAVHRDIDRPHVHVMLRGQAGEEELSLRRAFLTHGLCYLAQEVASRDRHLGLRDHEEILERPERDRARQKESEWSRERDRDDGSELG
jgi:hypothetical protein